MSSSSFVTGLDLHLRLMTYIGILIGIAKNLPYELRYIIVQER